MSPRSNGQQRMHYAMQLHNELQRQGRLRSLSWDDQVQGPTSNAVWTSTVFLDEIEYGKGTASTRQGARDIAARRALRALAQELYSHVGDSDWCYIILTDSIYRRTTKQGSTMAMRTILTRS
ncbi:hypothetical protein JB92DRAFT_2829416 [Gautieria morchelliformis]|nr:hypothetical protein JB92DRAFT_2829416 [Gautieria morchelliformis]